MDNYKVFDSRYQRETGKKVNFAPDNAALITE